MAKRLCSNCVHELFEGHCMLPIKGKKSTEWKSEREVLNDDGTCDHYKETPKWEALWDKISTPFYRIKWKYEKIHDFIRYKIINYIKYGFDIRDSWSVGSCTADFVVPRLRLLIDNKPMGVPSMLVDMDFVVEHKLEPYFGEEVDLTQGVVFDASEDLEECSDAWLNILEKIYVAMEICSDKYEDKHDVYDVNEHGEKNINTDKYKEQRKIVEEGLRLFGLFFESLWD